MKYPNLLIILSISIIICGCSTTYYGKYITTKVKDDPIDEFKAGKYVVIAFENPKKVGPEGWYWEFWVYFQNKVYFKYYLKTKIVAGTRNYYLVEEIPGRKPSTAASFTAKPNYDRVKDRLMSDLTDKGTPRIN